MAASVAAQLAKQTNSEIETTAGGLGEFSISIDGEKVIDTNRLWYPSPKKTVAKTVEILTQKSS